MTTINKMLWSQLALCCLVWAAAGIGVWFKGDSLQVRRAVYAAAVVCWLSAAVALGLCVLPPKYRLHGLLLGIFFRTGVPWGVGLALDRNVESLSNSGVFGWIVVFYGVTLVSETALSLAVVRSNNGIEQGIVTNG